MLTIQSEVDYEQGAHSQEGVRCCHYPVAEVVDGVGGFAGDVLYFVTVIRLRHRIVVEIRLDSDVTNFAGLLLERE